MSNLKRELLIPNVTLDFLVQIWVGPHGFDISFVDALIITSFFSKHQPTNKNVKRNISWCFVCPISIH